MSNNKALIITNIIILCCIIIGLLIFMFFGINGKYNFFKFENERLYSETYNLTEVNKIKADLKSYDIIFKESDNEDIQVEVYGNKKKKDNIKLDIKNNELNITQRVTSLCFGFCFSESLIVVHLPKEYHGELDLVTISGDIEINVDILNNVSLKTTSGDVKTRNLEDAIINSVSGDIRVKKAKDVKINTVSGDVRVEKSNNIDAKTTSGDITILEVSQKLDIKSTSGDVKVNEFTINNDSNISTVSGDVEVNLKNDADIKAETRSGDKDIKNSKGEFNLDIKTTSGDITVM